MDPGCLLCGMIEKCKDSGEHALDDAIAAGFVLGGLSEKFETFKQFFNDGTCDKHAEVIQQHFVAARDNFTQLLKEIK